MHFADVEKQIVDCPRITYSESSGRHFFHFQLVPYDITLAKPESQMIGVGMLYVYNLFTCILFTNYIEFTLK